MDTNFLQLRPDRLEPIDYFIDEPVALQRDLPTKSNPFKSFWMAGFECTDKLNAFGNRVDLLTLTGHLQLINEDYKRLSLLGLTTVREGIRWSHVEKKPYEYDWSEVAAMIRTGQENNIQQIWDLCHFGFPDDLTPLHPMFARRFASLCRAFVQFYRSIDTDGALIVTPINEVSFLSWLGGDVRGTSPYCVGQGWEVKYRLMKAYIEGVAALKEADPSIRILTTEPLVNIVPPGNANSEEMLSAAAMNEHQFQVTDILSGRMCPELGGQPEYLDILGYNYYYDNQWELGTNSLVHWGNKLDDERFIPLHKLLTNAQQRYNCPIVLTETSHPKEDRPLWIDMVADECALLLGYGIPLWGVCWYPVIDRPDWDHLHLWHQSGLWDGPFDTEMIERTLHIPSAAALLRAQKRLQPMLSANRARLIL
ncbi:MAG: amine oxidase [Ferruginibacter sp.]|nr:amine oxidase [Ferruginibacter sp.]